MFIGVDDSKAATTCVQRKIVMEKAGMNTQSIRTEGKGGIREGDLDSLSTQDPKHAASNEDEHSMSPIASKLGSLAACVTVALVAALMALGTGPVMWMLMGALIGWLILIAAVVSVVIAAQPPSSSSSHASHEALRGKNLSSPTRLDDVQRMSRVPGSRVSSKESRNATDAIVWSGNAWIRPGSPTSIGAPGSSAEWPPKPSSEAVVQVLRNGTMRVSAGEEVLRTLGAAHGVSRGGAAEFALSDSRVMVDSRVAYHRRRPLLLLPRDAADKRRRSGAAMTPLLPLEIFVSEAIEKQRLLAAVCGSGAAGAEAMHRIDRQRDAYTEHWSLLIDALRGSMSSARRRSASDVSNEREMLSSSPGTVAFAHEDTGDEEHEDTTTFRGAARTTEAKLKGDDKSSNDDNETAMDCVDDDASLIGSDYAPENFDLPTTTDGRSSIEPWEDSRGTPPPSSSSAARDSNNEGSGSSGASPAKLGGFADRDGGGGSSAASVALTESPDLLQAEVWNALLSNDEDSAAGVAAGIGGAGAVGGAGNLPSSSANSGEGVEVEVEEIELKEVDRSVHTGTASASLRRSLSSPPFSPSGDGGGAPDSSRADENSGGGTGDDDDSDAEETARHHRRSHQHTTSAASTRTPPRTKSMTDMQMGSSGDYFWFNALSSRVWFELRRNGFLASVFRERLRVQLNALERPRWMGALTCNGVTLCGPPPLVLHGELARSGSEGIIGSSGGGTHAFSVRDDNDDGLERMIGSPSSDLVARLDIHFAGEVKVLLGTNIDLIAFGESFRRGDSNGGGGDTTASSASGAGQDATTNSGRPILGSKLNLNLGGKLGVLAKTLARQVSEVRIELELTCSCVDGTLLLSLPSPPSSTVWWCFEDEPLLKATAKPLIGGHGLGKANGAIATRVSNWIMHRLRREVREQCVYPNRSYFAMPFADDDVLDLVEREEAAMEAHAMASAADVPESLRARSREPFAGDEAQSFHDEKVSEGADIQVMPRSKSDSKAMPDPRLRRAQFNEEERGDSNTSAAAMTSSGGGTSFRSEYLRHHQHAVGRGAKTRRALYKDDDVHDDAISAAKEKDEEETGASTSNGRFPSPPTDVDAGVVTPHHHDGNTISHTGHDGNDSRGSDSGTNNAVPRSRGVSDDEEVRRSIIADFPDPNPGKAAHGSPSTRLSDRSSSAGGETTAMAQALFAVAATGVNSRSNILSSLQTRVKNQKEAFASVFGEKKQKASSAIRGAIPNLPFRKTESGNGQTSSKKA